MKFHIALNVAANPRLHTTEKLQQARRRLTDALLIAKTESRYAMLQVRINAIDVVLEAR